MLKQSVEVVCVVCGECNRNWLALSLLFPSQKGGGKKIFSRRRASHAVISACFLCRHVDRSRPVLKERMYVCFEAHAHAPRLVKIVTCKWRVYVVAASLVQKVVGMWVFTLRHRLR